MATLTPSGPDGDRASGSLREQKKALTRQALVDEAIARFLDQGYDRTTLEEIAAAVPVSLRTLLRYFESKERLFHAWHYAALERFGRELADRPAEQSVLAFWRAWVDRFAGRSDASPDFLAHRLLQERHPSLHAHWLTIMREYEDRLTAALLAEVGADRRLEARLAAVALVGGNEAVVRGWAASEPRTDLRPACLEVVDVVNRLFASVGISLDGGPQAARRRRTSSAARTSDGAGRAGGSRRSSKGATGGSHT